MCYNKEKSTGRFCHQYQRMIPAGGTYATDASQAAELVNIIRPESAVPIHYCSVVGDPSDGEVFRKKADSGIRGVIKL